MRINLLFPSWIKVPNEKCSDNAEDNARGSLVFMNSSQVRVFMKSPGPIVRERELEYLSVSQ